MSNPRPRITLYLDIVSPWSRVALIILKRYESVWDFELVLRPIYLGGVMHAAGNKPPATIVNKAIWMREDMRRISEIGGFKLEMPASFPVQTIATIRFLRVLQDKHPDKLYSAVDTLAEALWERDEPVGDPKQIPSILSRIVDEATSNSLVAESSTPENKERVKQEATQLVEEGGAFGFPWIVVETADRSRTESFFGSDRFDFIAYMRVVCCSVSSAKSADSTAQARQEV